MRIFFALIFLVFSSHGLFAQWESPRLAKPTQTETVDTLKKDPLDFHLSLGTEVRICNGSASSLFWIAPEVSYQVSPKFKVRASFFYGTDLLNSNLLSSPKSDVDLSPREKPTSVKSFYARGEYTVNNRLQLAATIFYESGTPFCPMLNTETIGFSTEMEYAISEKSILNISFSFIHSSEDSSLFPSTTRQFQGDRIGFGYAPSMFGRFR